MKSEFLLSCFGDIDPRFVENAERKIKPGAQNKKRPDRILRIVPAAACFAVIFIIGVTAYAIGAMNSLIAYFTGETEMYLEEILSAVDSASNEDIEIRIEGAIADERACHFIVSFIGLTDEGKRTIEQSNLEIQNSFEYYAELADNEYYNNFDTESFSYVFEKKAKTMFADADQTYIVSYKCNKLDNINMSDVETLFFSYEGLTLGVDVQQYMSEERQLYADPSEDTGKIVDLSVSRIGIYFTVVFDEGSYDEPNLNISEIFLIYADGTVDKNTMREIGCKLNYGYSTGDKTTYASGRWGGHSLVILDLDKYCGVQIDGVNYYFTAE
jgi:hypothetical protein